MYINSTGLICNSNKIITNPRKQSTVNPITKANLSGDVFIKSKEVSFKAKELSEKKRVGLSDTIIGAGTVGAAFLIPLIFSTAIAKNQNPDEIFLSDGSYMGHSDKLLIDENKAKELGFDLDPNKFKGPNCVCDEINGIYKDFSKGIDINLQEGKYVDIENGVFVKPDENASVVFTNGDVLPVIVPNFGSGYPTRPEDPRWRSDEIKEENGSGEAKDILEKTKEFFNDEKYSSVTHDFWGREFVTLEDSLGNSHKVPLTNDLDDKMDDGLISYEKALSVLSDDAEEPISGYFKENFLTDTNYTHFSNPSVEDFIQKINTSGIDNIQENESIHSDEDNSNSQINEANTLHNGVDDDITWLN